MHSIECNLKCVCVVCEPEKVLEINISSKGIICGVKSTFKSVSAIALQVVCGSRAVHLPFAHRMRQRMPRQYCNFI